MAWQGDERAYLAGVKRTGAVALAMLPLVFLFPLHVMLLGFVGAVTHSVHGFLFAVATLDVLFIGYQKVPFACSYVPVENPKLVWPTAAASFLLATYGFAYAERSALQTPARAAAFCASLVALAAAARLVDRVQRRERLPVNFDEGPSPATLRRACSSAWRSANNAFE